MKICTMKVFNETAACASVRAKPAVATDREVAAVHALAEPPLAVHGARGERARKFVAVRFGARACAVEVPSQVKT